jgi:flagellar hook assembly protein FlgD
VRLLVTDVAGRHVREIVDATQPAGAHSVAWDRRDESGRVVASGVYLYRLEVDGRSLSRRMIVVR